MRRRLLYALGTAASVAAALLVAPRVKPASPPPATAAGGRPMPPLSRTVALAHDPEPSAQESDPAAGLDLTRIAFADGISSAPVARGTAQLTIDPDLQRAAVSLMAARHLPEAAIVLMDVTSGRLLVYASHVETGPRRDLCAEATAPSASVFKIVTAAALVEDAHLGPDTKQCYLGGEQRIFPIDLVDDPHRDKWCTTLAGAMGRSINAVFARLAKERLEPKQLEEMARRFGFGQPVPFDVPVTASAVHIPDEPLEFARTAAGFWNSTLSPLQAAEISAIVARGGETVRPVVVDKIVGDSGALVWSAPESPPNHRAIARDTADKLATMMEHTVTEGTSFRAFHDARALSFLPGIGVAGKTGTLTDGATHRYYTWFTGFAPTKPIEGVPQIAVAVLVVNGPVWQVKANGIARDTLRSYFASHDVTGVTRPSVSAIARHKPRH